MTATAAESGPRTRGPWRRLGTGLAVVALLPALAVLGSILAGGEVNVLVASLALLDGWLLPLTLLALAVSLGARSWWLAVLGAVLLLVGLVVVPPFPSGGAAAAPGATRLRVAALNLLFGGADAGAVVAQVRAMSPDVLVLTELTPPAVSALRAAGLERELPYSWVLARPSASGTGVWSRTPLEATAQIPGTTYATLRADVTLPGGPVTVVAVHPFPPLDVDVWAADYRLLQTAIDTALDAGRPVVVAGDFNAGSGSGPLRRLLTTGLVDTATATGWAWQRWSWPADRAIPPVAVLDHVLAGPSLGVQDASTFAVPGTDHRGVVATLSVPAG